MLILLPSILSLVLYYALMNFRRTIRITVAVFLQLLVLPAALIVISDYENIPFIPVITWFTLIAFTVACSVSISMAIFDNILSKKGETIAAFLVPFVSFPFIITMVIVPEMIAGQHFPPDFFGQRLFLTGWFLDLITDSSQFIAGEESITALVILHFGFFAEILIVMIIIFGFFKLITDCYKNL
ncbi:hypothetical protein [Methanoplanus limicola]|uniref:hypothetical protein n=1 Tax=Methanoplanus limicola TaxID=2315 RepID=UPI00064EA1A3|nr:hypothetical protein [Methanoplanus limicola]